MQITPEIVQTSEQRLEENIERRRAAGKVVEVIRPPYHEGLSNVRCVLRINGNDVRMVYSPKKRLWRKADL